jgi:hypothetical protein
MCSTVWNDPCILLYSLKEVQGYIMLAYGVTLPVEEPRGLRRALSSGGVVCTVEAWHRYCGTTATCSSTCATAEGVVSVFWHTSIVPCHTWFCSRRGVFVLVVSLSIEGRGLGGGKCNTSGV